MGEGIFAGIGIAIILGFVFLCGGTVKEGGIRNDCQAFGATQLYAVKYECRPAEVKDRH